MLVARRVLGLDPVAGLYHPLGAAAPERTQAAGDRRRATTPGWSRSGWCARTVKPPEELDEALERAEAIAVEAATGMRAGRVRRDPLNGECPRYCTYQPICRLERALGAVGDETSNGGEPA